MKLNQLYRAIGISKQAVHQKLNRQIAKMEELNYLIPIVDQVRKDHPRMSLRYIYQLIKPQTMGRDAFERQFAELGYKVRIDRNFRKTTDSTGVVRFDNLLLDQELTDVNQVLVSDITYYEMEGKFYYLTFITDLFSRKILGACSSSTLRTEYTTLPAMQQALQARAGSDLRGTIIHSDGGGQYYSKKFLSLTKKIGLLNSMGKEVYDNPHAERINGVIKNNYIKPYCPKSRMELVKALKKAVRMYNTEKPHSALGGMSPDNYEQVINKEKRRKKESYKSNSNSLLKTVNTI